ncbi:MAG TPA: mannose-1-phosphate guanylyltransferase [Deltaproteobacteria bacterium]|nr:mannose-1-phosphate guanylyltransferase [Deltaproteobacteria bacterium]
MHAVIMAGGRGTRFWPRSREKKPKHLLDITGDKTLIQQTFDRVKPIVGPKNVLIVTGKKHARELARQLPEVPAENIIIEPQGKNTAACIGLAALHIIKKYGDGVMVLLPADHAIGNPEEYQKVLSAAIQATQQPEALITIGIKPDSPQTGFGYIEKGEALPAVSGREIFRVLSIREKPDTALAQSFVQSGNFYWNSGMFVWKASVILDQIEKFLPELHKGLTEIENSFGSTREARTVAAVYKNLPSVSIDYGVMEKAQNVFVLPADFGWSDVGSWDAVCDLALKDDKGNASTTDSQVIFEDTSNSFVYSPHKLTALVGVKDLIVVDTKDALLICKKGRSQDIRNVVEKLERKKMKKYL